ncbi:MAG: VanZ family protein [Gammaproteobacteria bacterium]
MFNKNIRLWIYGVFLAIGSVPLFLGGPDYYSSRSFKHFWDLGHIVYFALLAGLLSQWSLVSRKSLAWQWTIILLITLVVGVSIEFMQHSAARTPDTGDVLRDLTGSLLVLVYGSLRSKLQPVSRRLSLQIAVLVLLLVQLWPVTKSLVDEAIARHQFPLLSGLETPFEIDRWAGSAELSVESMASISHGKFLKLSLSTDQYSGAALNFFDGNWIPARTLKISLYNPDTNPLQITCRIHDLQHVDGDEEYEDRFNRSFLLMQGWSHIEIDLDEVEESPANRSMDMSRIRGLGIFVVSLHTPRILYLDEVRLIY